ncbi:uncharacterized protein SCHCODRAFT_01050459, partial [Schizophyllum commune H4-8]
MVKAFITHVFGVGSAHRGLYGPTSAYYAAVEQQGRLTLHLHSLLWIRGAPSPQTIRDRLLGGDTAFEREMIRYLEEMQTGQFLTGDIETVRARQKDATRRKGAYEDPTQTLPEPPPPPCKCKQRACECADKRKLWWSRFKETVDDLILRVQIHRCIRKRGARAAESAAKGRKDPLEGIKGCKGDDDICEARFPRDYVSKSYVDRVTGAIHLVKTEVMMNCVTPVVTYLTRGNTDTTSLQSGTSMKAVVLYVSDYITKCSLKTYHIMSCIKAVFERHAAAFQGAPRDATSARKLMMKMVNALAPRMEIGSPMAASYLLGFPDHYKSHELVIFWWKNYVNRVLDDWPESVRSGTFEERLILKKEDGQVIGTSIVDDYVHRPRKYENYCLFEWIQCAKKTKRTANQLKSFLAANADVAPGDADEDVNAGDDAVPVEAHTPPVNSADDVPDVLDDLDRIPKAVDLMDGTQKSPMAVNRQPPYASFLDTHPQHASHHVWCDPSKRHYIVPNFVGGSIPRSDQGDREYYCATMLTLFSPWRRGRDLKVEGYDWDHAFRAYEFKGRHLQLMENFNLRYECADARDDYRNELKKKKRVGAVNFRIEDAEDDGDGGVGYPGSYGEDLDYDAPDDGETGPGWNRVYQIVDFARTYAGTSGWTEIRKDDKHPAPTSSIPKGARRGSEWASYIKNLKDSIFHAKLRSVPVGNGSRNAAGTSSGMHETGVVNLPASYFTKEYSADKPDLRTLIEDIVSEFSLNADQQRAFTLIANHA